MRVCIMRVRDMRVYGSLVRVTCTGTVLAYGYGACVRVRCLRTGTVLAYGYG